MAHKTKAATHKKSGKYEKNKPRVEVNRKRKRLKHMKNNPNDKTLEGKV